MGPQPLDQEVRDRDNEHKMISKFYADKRRGAWQSVVEAGDEVVVQQDCQNKLFIPFNPIPHRVTARTGNAVIVESPEGAEYNRNSTQIQKFVEQIKPGDQANPSEQASPTLASGDPG